MNIFLITVPVRLDTKSYCFCVSYSVMSNSLWPHNCSPSVSSIHEILLARRLQWVAIPFWGIFLAQKLNPSRLPSRQILYSLNHQRSPNLTIAVQLSNHVQLFPTEYFVGFSLQVYWGGLPFPPLWITFYLNTPLWLICLGWPCMVWFIVSWVI